MLSSVSAESYKMEIFKYLLDKYQFNLAINDIYRMMSNISTETYRLMILEEFSYWTLELISEKDIKRLTNYFTHDDYKLKAKGILSLMS